MICSDVYKRQGREGQMGAAAREEEAVAEAEKVEEVTEA